MVFKTNSIPWNKGKTYKLKHEKQFKKGMIPWNLGKRYSMKHAGQFKKGTPAWNKGIKGSTSVPKCESFKEYRKKVWTGENNPNWRNGSSSKEKIIKNSAIWRNWRETVFSRDNFTCKICGKRGGKLHPDHIKPFSKYPELRFDINNGRTLCVPCHRKTPTYGSKCNYLTRSTR